jgi:hypothetical protein
MTTAAELGAEDLREDLRGRGVETPEDEEIDRQLVVGVALVAAGLITSRLVGSAKSTAMRVNSSTATPREVADAVEEALSDLSTDGPRPQLNAALVGSMNEARIEVARKVPSAAVYGSEKMDRNTCFPCLQVHGRWIGNVDTDLEDIRQLYPGGAFGGYVHCEGRERCRGTIHVEPARPKFEEDEG